MRDARASYAVLVGGLAAGAIYFLFPAGGPRAALFLGMVGLPLILLILRLHRERLLRDRAWGVLLAGLALYVAGTAIWYLFPLLAERELPFPSPLDGLFFAAYGLHALFMLRLLQRRHRGDRSEERRATAVYLVDAGLFAVAAMAILWPLVFTPLATTAGVTTPQVLTGAGYPLVQAVLFGLLVRFLSAGRRLAGDEVLLALWVGAELASGISYGVVSAAGEFHFGHPMMFGWLVSYGALSGAALHPSLTTPSDSPRSPLVVRGWRPWLLLPAALAPIAVALLLQMLRGDLDATTRGVLIGLVVLSVSLAFVRSRLLSGDLLEQRRLTAELQVLTGQLDEKSSQLEHQSMHDELTGLGNRRMLLQRLEHATRQRPARPDVGTGVLLLDLDGFKAINDTLGHSCGDEVLISVSERLSAMLRPGDTLTRLGGDEFAVVLEHVDAAQAARTAQRIVEGLRAPVIVDGHDLSVWASVGVDVVETGTAPKDCLKHADLAMYAAKGAGGDRYLFFDPTMQEAVLGRVQLERDLRCAVQNDELRLLYQPIVDVKSGSVIGVEALVRWQHPRRGLLMPTTFISAAEACGAIIGIGTWVLEQSCRQAAQWLRDDDMPDRFNIAVNVSRRQLAEPDIVEVVTSTITQTGVPADQVCLEITERDLFDDPSELVTTIEQLKRLGVTIAMDDFGTGHSTLLQLRRLPVDILKIDRAFIAHIGDAREDYALAKAVVRLAASLGKTTLAEGVEDDAQFAHLLSLHVDQAQGYLFSEPLEAAAIPGVVAASRRRRVRLR
jgi:diguanylate cyclase (GGDEF)-like protein